MFESIDVASVTLVHVLKLDPGLAARDPKIEDRMNHTVIKNLSDLGDLIRRRLGYYTPNARTVKFVLSHPVPEIIRFLDGLPTELVEKIHAGVQADEYDRMRSYELSALCIAEYLRNRHAAPPRLQIA